jgi:hypothetical protein
MKMVVFRVVAPCSLVRLPTFQRYLLPQSLLIVLMMEAASTSENWLTTIRIHGA